jgi:hypothetical protein
VIEITLGAQLNTNANPVTVQLSESNDTVVTNFATFNASFNRTLANVAGTVTALCVDVKARKRYLRLTLTPDTTTNGPVITSAIGIIEPELKNPSNTSNADTVVVG